MTLLISYDTETCGIPDWKIPSDDPSQPHLVQLAAVVVDADTREVVDSLDVIIKPDGWEIPDEVAAIHGITTEIAMEKGIPETEAVDKLLAMCNGCTRIAYNRTFDQRIIRIALKRYGYGEDVMEAWGDKTNHECSMFMAKKAMGYQPKLSAAYKHFTGKDMEGAHSARNDALASLEVYFAILDGKGGEDADTQQAGR